MKMRKHVITFFSVFCCLWFCCGWFCNKSLGVSADEPLQITKMSIADTRAFFGDSFPAKIRWTGVSTWRDTTFTFDYSVSSLPVSSLNLAQNFFADSAFEFADYDVLVYHCNAFDTDAHDLLIDLPMYFPDYALGAFAVTNRLNGWSWSGISDSVNSISTYPDNYYTDFDAVAAREPSTAYGAFWYHPSGGTQFWRLFPYQCDSDGTFFRTLSVQSVQAYYDDGYKLQLMIFCPHIGTAPQHSEPAITTTVTTDAAALPPITVNVDVDLGPVVSGLDGIAGQVAQAKEDVQGIATDISAIGSLLAVDERQTQSVLYLDPIDTLPTLDYHQVIDDVDAVLDDIPNAVAGTASIWGIISASFTSDSVWLWLVPLCIFLCLASFVLWRR